MDAQAVPGWDAGVVPNMQPRACTPRDAPSPRMQLRHYGAHRSRGCTCRSGLAGGPRAACGPVRPGYAGREQAHDALQGQGLRSARHTQAAALTSPQAAADPHVPRSPRQRLGDGVRPVRALRYRGEGTVLPKLPFPWRSPQPTYFLCSRVQRGTAY